MSHYDLYDKLEATSQTLTQLVPFCKEYLSVPHWLPRHQ